MSIFGNLFDFNRDGNTDVFEQAMGFAILDELSKEDEEGEDEGEDI